MKKNGILTLLFACIPGAGQMYQGYMKRGLSLITMFCLFIIVGSATGLDALVVGCIVVYMYSFFDTFNLRAQIIAENAPADDYLVHINWKDKRMQDFMMDSHKLLGWGLIALGGLVAYENVIMRVFGDVMWRWGQNNPVFRAFYLMLDELPQIVTCVALIVCGLWLVRGPKGKKVHRKKAEEPEDEDFREYTAAEADAPEAPEETADFAMPKLSALLGDPVTPEDRNSRRMRRATMDELNKTAATEPETRPEAAKLQDAPRRRVGSLTMGACLIAAGIFFLCYYFVPGFDWQLVVRIAPAAALVLLGCEVLFFAARPGRWKYDFVSVLVCLGLIAVCMCLSFLPMVWSEIDPARGQNEMKLSKAYTTQVYEALRKENPDLRLRDVYTDLYLYANSVDDLQELQPSDGHLSLTVMLYGPYDSTGAFAQDCRSVAGTVRAGTLQPDELRITWSPDNDPGQSLDSGTLQRVEQYTLELDGTVQLDWTADEMERQVEVQYLLDEENEPEEDTAPGEEAEPEAAV